MRKTDTDTDMEVTDSDRAVTLTGVWFDLAEATGLPAGCLGELLVGRVETERLVISH